MSIYIVASLIAIVCALACYVFISQSIEKKRIRRQRLLMALKTKQRNFVYMINGFPPHFLTAELMGVIYRALIDTCEQLSALEPRDQRHLGDISLYTNQLAALAKSGPVQRIRLDNPQQMKDIRQHLQELQRFIVQQESVKAINKVQADSYLDQVKRVNLQMTVDAYVYHAKQAQQIGKFRLAIHYFGLAKKLLTTENSSRTYDKQITQLDLIITKLEEQTHVKGEPEQAEESALQAKEAVNKEWDTYTAAEETWKKKQIYD